VKWFKPSRKARPTPPTPERREFGEALSNFTPRAQQVLALARQEADHFQHQFVGTEHLLLGLIKLGQGTAVAVLGRMGLDLETVRLEVEKQVGPGPDQIVHGSIAPYTPRVKKVLALADKERKALSHTYLGTEHILLGLLREGDGVAARVLKNLGVDIEATRQNVLKELDPNYLPPRAETAMSQKPELQKAQAQTVDVSKRYDVYCREGDQQVVYRNALFRGVKQLLPQTEYDVWSDYIELEQAAGGSIFISRSSIVKFCEHGTAPTSEAV
jgi:ATP-dependent Clp protease ATP-binding subunit ClpA